MNLITLDFETYYDGSIKLGFKTQTTEEYIRDPRFEVVGVGVKIGSGETTWVTENIKDYLSSLPWDVSMLLCHNTLFDGAILSWIYGINPSFMLDTLSMARALHGVEAGGSLAALAERYGIGQKGDEVVRAEGKRKQDFTEEELAAYGRYCCNDVELTHTLFSILSKKFPDDEYALIDMTLRMYTEPVLEVDDALLNARLEELGQEKSALLSGLMGTLSCSSEEEVRKKLASNKQFALVLMDFNVDPPMKISKTTGKPTLALAKTDEGFLALQEHYDPVIQQLCAVRLGTKSTIEESRIQRFIDMGARNKGKVPVPLKYYGAHTGRWAGMDKVNFQNLPSRDQKKKTLKNAIVAPAGYSIINADSSQIEARILAWLAGQEDVVNQFSRGEDVYSIFASKIYRRKITKADPVERFVGKTCILGLGYGTGAAKLKHTLRTTPPGIEFTDEQAEGVVTLYRHVNHNIPYLWKMGDQVIKDLIGWDPDSESYYFGEHRCLLVERQGIRLPNGLHIRYPGLFRNEQGKFCYKSRKGMVDIWGGTVVENVVQALAKIVVGEQMLRIQQRYPVAMTVHDAAVLVVRDEELEEAKAYVAECMSTPPDWAQMVDGGSVWMRLPITCEVKSGKRYGECG